MLAPILPRPTIPTCINVTPFPDVIALPCQGLPSDSAFLRDLLVMKLHGRGPRRCPQTRGSDAQFLYCLLPRYLVCAPAHERIPEARATHREANEPRNSRRSCQPLVYFLIILAAPKDDTANFVSVAATCRGYKVFA